MKLAEVSQQARLVGERGRNIFAVQAIKKLISARRGNLCLKFHLFIRFHEQFIQHDGKRNLVVSYDMCCLIISIALAKVKQYFLHLSLFPVTVIDFLEILKQTKTYSRYIQLARRWRLGLKRYISTISGKVFMLCVQCWCVARASGRQEGKGLWGRAEVFKQGGID